jgi:hypothetical protein
VLPSENFLYFLNPKPFELCLCHNNKGRFLWVCEVKGFPILVSLLYSVIKRFKIDEVLFDLNPKPIISTLKAKGWRTYMEGGRELATGP